MTRGNEQDLKRHYEAQSDQPPPPEKPEDDGMGGRAGFSIDDSKIYIIRHPNNAGLAQGNDVVQKDEEQASE